MERIHRAMIQDRLAHYQETESRRPDYLRRMKRTLVNADTAALLEDEGAQELAAIGIMESPVKGRRLKLFQETSEESFEESLMAGGYGRYVRRLVAISPPLTNHLAAHGGVGSSTTALNTGSSRPCWTVQYCLSPGRGGWSSANRERAQEAKTARSISP